MPHKNRIDYLIVDQWPPGGLSIAESAKERKCSQSYIYMLYAKGRLNIVVFHTYNFVVSQSDETLIAGGYAKREGQKKLSSF